jgi:hypothetical protein
MRYSLPLAFVFLLIVTGCGGGGGGGGSGGGGPPPPPPVEVVQAYDADLTEAGGRFAAQGDTSVEFNVDHLRLTFDTVLGEVVCYPTNSSTGWRATVEIAGVDHLVWFWPQENALIVSESGTEHRAQWVLTEIVGGG